MHGDRLLLGAALTSVLIFFAVAFAGAVILLVAHQLRQGLAAPGIPIALDLVVPAGLSWSLTHQGWALVGVSIVVLAWAWVWWRQRRFSAPGLFFLITYGGMLIAFLAWGVWFLLTIPVSPLTRALLLCGYPLLIVTLPSGLLQSFTDWEGLCRSSWRRKPRTEDLGTRPRAAYPKVSIHVPSHAEPPALVIATLDALAALEYPNYEVLVIDNNTTDPGLWQPVDAHCRRLGPRFRFFHVENLAGAKAGALNFALTRTAGDAEVISVVDADYLAESDFLSRLIGHFDDPRMGFVQTPHDYREWEGSLYLRMCYWEYRYFFASTMVSLDEHEAGLTVGTMCLIRRRALEAAGGWSEWCVTEDSELAIRIHAQGYTSVYLPTTFGRGLIPQTFGGFKRQRFRWTYGPIQELKHHLRMFLPGRWRWTRHSRLSPVQKILHLNHGLDRLNIGLQFLILPVGAAAVGSMIWHHEIIAVPPALWLASTVTLVSGWIMWWLPYRALLGASMPDVIGAFVASKALGHTITMSSVKSLYTRRIPWLRTSKFAELPLGLGALMATKAELALGAATLAAGVAALLLVPRPGLLLLLVIGGFYQALGYLAAPVMAVLSERDVATESSLAADLAVEGRQPLRESSASPA